MDFLWNEEQEQIRDAVERACAPFDADYWLRKDHEGGFPHDFHKALADAGWLDRKSTRLNSSHLVISYAVFCLKKKKTLPPQHRPALQSHDTIACVGYCIS